ncbi:class I SAM-dependent methyltransferase [Leifsonia sp. ZF2019]|uniref:class I SAM-dependent DNA methyltransferase n=1 Tax=Leifsonia sp. ZF2019 TaxID=2781978 RepID=UPI001CBCA1A5|nr:class I SAM-dependent methyltransferase [Leifsonia sp. ZF2019]UAJ80329.1 class I SAM-dependent methyltransferase [Leifsonia sp. ZF2019]
MSETADTAATRAAYDVVARSYADLLRDDLRTNVFDRAALAAFAEQIDADGGGAVADLGCGPGRIAGHLADRGLDISGVDLSPGMVEVARREHPDLTFAVGSMLDLPFADAGLAGALAWYSIIHIAQDEQDALFREFARVVRPGGRLLLAFQVSAAGDEDVVHLTRAYGHDIDLRTRRQSVGRVRERLAVAGFSVVAELVREPVAPEKSRQAYVFAQRTTVSASPASSAS